ncbi:MAG TPA: cytochrome c [Hyphomicrobiaceae bacterium]|nr:cytochrome c [Hyphomicrobiaceae bacterium]
MSSRRVASLAAVAGAVLMWGSSSGQEMNLPNGRAVAQVHCSGCHAIGSADESPNSAAPPLRSLVKRSGLVRLEEALHDGAIAGHPELPELEQGAVAALVAYLGSIAEN